MYILHLQSAPQLPLKRAPFWPKVISFQGPCRSMNEPVLPMFELQMTMSQHEQHKPQHEQHERHEQRSLVLRVHKVRPRRRLLAVQRHGLGVRHQPRHERVAVQVRRNHALRSAVSSST